MCGIVGIYSPRSTVASEELKHVIGRLTHRGPDGQRTWVSGDRVGLGHARLSIIDLATGDQPIASEDERLQIVVNGEFYDFERVQRDLEAGATASAPARTARSPCTSTRTSARPACSTCAASSPSCSGTAPTTRSSPRGIASASSRSTTSRGDGCTSPPRSRRCSRPACRPAGTAPFFRANHSSCPPQDRTLFDGIHQVPPGHFLLATAGQVRLIRYWDFDYPPADRRRLGAPDAEYAERSGTSSMRQSACASGPMCRSAVTSAGDRLLCRAGPGGHARSDPIRAFTLTFDRPATTSGASPARWPARRGRVPPDPDPAIRPRRPLRRCDLAGRDARVQRPRRGEVPAQPGRARRRLQGRADRRRLGRDPRRLPPLPAGHGAAQLAGTRPVRASGSSWRQLEAGNPVSRGLLLPDGEAARW